MTRQGLAVLAAMMIAAPAMAQDPARTERVQFAHGASSKAITGSISSCIGVVVHI
jgi:hypothetical protein